MTLRLPVSFLLAVVIAGSALAAEPSPQATSPTNPLGGKPADAKAAPGQPRVISWEEPADVLVKAIRKVHAGEMWLGRTGTAAVITRLANRGPKDADTLRVESLTRREWDIVMLVAEGLKNKQIAERLCISEATARNHLTSILDKLGLQDRFELAVYTFRRGLVACPQTPAILRRWSS